MLLLRRLVVRQHGLYSIVPEQRPVVEYYANSIAHFFATREEQDAPSRAARSGGRAVVLVHGLARTSRSMAHMATALHAAGFQVYNWDYPSRRYGLAMLAESLAAFINEVAGRHEVVDFVTHSMGGLLVRAVLAHDRPANVGRVVMLAPPNQGASMAARAKEFGWARRFFGQSLDDLAALGHDEGPMRPGGPKYPVGIIAGTRSFHPLQPSSYYLSLVQPWGTHDGTVKLDETRLPGMVDFVTVRANHTFIMDHDETVRQTLAFLERGRFDGSD
jgi:pimeloyl-ACP methyl ester carboxylesterase